MTTHANLNVEQSKTDDLLYQHFYKEGHKGLEDMRVQIIDWVKGEKELREKEGQWIYKLGTIVPNGLNDNDGSYAQNRKSHAGVRKC